MTKVKAYLVKAFTKDPKQGNPAGVVLNAKGLAEKQMLSVASSLDFSESSFVRDLREDNFIKRIFSYFADFNVRFFTPEIEVPLCGHATIATFHMLVNKDLILFDKQDKVIVKQINKMRFPRFPLPVECHKDGLIIMTRNNPNFYTPIHNKEIIVKLLSINKKDIVDDYVMQVVGEKLFIPVRNLDILFKIKPDLQGIKTYSKETGVRGFYPFTTETIDKDSDFHVRQFNPLAGIDEDPITGMAAGALGAYVRKYKIKDKNRITVEQGYILKKFGKVFVDFEDKIKIGGYATIAGERVIEV